MTLKEEVITIINHLPAEADMDEIMQALYVRSKFKHGADEIDKGKATPHNEAVNIMRSWQK
jgi:hypothetical protein